MAGPVLECIDVSKRFGGVRALDQVSIALMPGELLGLVGPNGAGKTTLVDLIGGEQRVDSGQVLAGGRPMSGPPSRRLRLNGLARTFQHPQVALDMTVAENLLIGAAGVHLRTPLAMLAELLRGMTRPSIEGTLPEIQRVADSLGLGRLQRPCSDLTLGELRLLEVARALLAKPSLILLDEPFAGSDAHGVAGIRASLAEVLRGGVSIILVDHNVDIVASLAQRIVLLDRGRKVFDGDPQDCLRSPEMQQVYFGKAPVA